VKKQRKHHAAEEKVAILRHRPVKNVAVSDLCEELGLQPSQRRTAQVPRFTFGQRGQIVGYGSLRSRWLLTANAR
jgi:hypothetical protein